MLFFFVIICCVCLCVCMYPCVVFVYVCVCVYLCNKWLRALVCFPMSRVIKMADRGDNINVSRKRERGKNSQERAELLDNVALTALPRSRLPPDNGRASRLLSPCLAHRLLASSAVAGTSAFSDRKGGDTCSLTHALTHALTHSIIHSRTHALTN